MEHGNVWILGVKLVLASFIYIQLLLGICVSYLYFIDFIKYIACILSILRAAKHINDYLV